MTNLIDFYFKICGLKLNYIDLGEYKMEYWMGNKDKPVVLLLHAFGPNGKCCHPRHEKAASQWSCTLTLWQRTIRLPCIGVHFQPLITPWCC